MNAEQRRALHLKHTARITDYVPFCRACEMRMPCDTIRVLTWAEEMMRFRASENGEK